MYLCIRRSKREGNRLIFIKGVFLCLTEGGFLYLTGTERSLYLTGTERSLCMSSWYRGSLVERGLSASFLQRGLST